MVLLQDEDSPQPSRLRPRAAAAVLMAVVLIGVVGLVSGGVLEIAKLRARIYPVLAPVSGLAPIAVKRLPTNVAASRVPTSIAASPLPTPSAASLQHAHAVVRTPSVPFGPTKQESQKTHVAQRVSNLAIIHGTIAPPKRQTTAISREPRVDRAVAFLPVRHTIELPRSIIPQPLPLQNPTPTPEAIIGDLYAQANPDTDVLSVVVVHHSAGTIVADVTSREDGATIIDRLTLAPRAHSFDVVATERLTQDAQSAHACFVRGVWRSC